MINGLHCLYLIMVDIIPPIMSLSVSYMYISLIIVVDIIIIDIQ